MPNHARIFSKIGERSSGRLPRTRTRQADPQSPKVAENQYIIFDIALGYFPRSENDPPGGGPELNPPSLSEATKTADDQYL